MREKTRIPKILKQLENIWYEHPDLRLGQLINNVFDENNSLIANIYKILMIKIA